MTIQNKSSASRTAHSNRVALARNLRKQDTWAEKLLWSWLRDRRFCAYKLRRQHPLGCYILDFYCVEAHVDIELDGRQHGFPQQRQADAQRDRWLETQGIRVLRFWNSRLRKEGQHIRDMIWSTLQARAPHPLPDYCRPGLCTSTRLSQSEGQMVPAQRKAGP